MAAMKSGTAGVKSLTAVFSDKYEQNVLTDLPKPSPPVNLTKDHGKKVKLITNFFSIVPSGDGGFFHYHYMIQPPPKTLAQDKEVITMVWPQLQEHFKNVFVVRSPNQLFSPTHVEKPLELDTGKWKVTISMHQRFSRAQLEQGIFGEAEVVLRHVVNRLAAPLIADKIGRRYYKTHTEKTQADLYFFVGFQAAMQKLSSHGPLMQLDAMCLPLRKGLTILSFMAQMFQRAPPTDTPPGARAAQEAAGEDENAHLILTDPVVAAEWRRRCLFSAVVQKYTQKVYRIKDVCLDMTPASKTTIYNRAEKKQEEMSFIQYYKTYYQTDISELRQPMLEAVPEKNSQKVYLVPELCLFTGFTDDVKKDKSTVSEMLKKAQVAPGERLANIQSIATEIATKAVESNNEEGIKTKKTLEAWKFKFNEQPLEVHARVMDALKVSFTDPDKQYAIEDGTFQRWMRNGLACPSRLDDWIFVYPDTVCPFVDIWLRSLRDIAQVAFTMHVVNPTRIICSDQPDNMEKALEAKLTPKTQLVLVILSGTSSRKAYQHLKTLTIRKYPCITQVVKSETMQKRNSIAAVLSRIVLQINAKLCGPLWHIDLKHQLTNPLMTKPTMVIGLDVFRNYDAGKCEKYMGFAASLNTRCSQYYSTAAKLEPPGRERRSMALKLKEALRDALAVFAERNDLLPEHVIVFRNSVSDNEWADIKATEIDAMQSLLKDVGQLPGASEYEPDFTYVIIGRQTCARFFSPAIEKDVQVYKNPEPGTVVDSPSICRAELPNFYLLSHMAANKGTALPVHYMVLYDTANVPLTSLQSFCYRLCFLYYNHTGSVKIPAPAQYAKKIAHLIGTTTQEEPAPRLRCTFFYL
mmetsp:Transcript_821/g.1666  ORF Transcript_821/g.1666 Transcript_821/m.1666 type:complete len:860 (+) Transcript_821:79-2658(+)